MKSRSLLVAISLLAALGLGLVWLTTRTSATEPPQAAAYGVVRRVASGPSVRAPLQLPEPEPSAASTEDDRDSQRAPVPVEVQDTARWKVVGSKLIDTATASVWSLDGDAPVRITPAPSADSKEAAVLRLLAGRGDGGARDVEVRAELQRAIEDLQDKAEAERLKPWN